MKVLVCGGRGYNDHDKVNQTLDQFCLDRGLMDSMGYLPDPTRLEAVIHGGARGADALADAWAITNFVPVREFKADWNTFGRKAGALRNYDMLTIGQPDVVIAFPGGNGTGHMKKIARQAGVEVIEVK